MQFKKVSLPVVNTLIVSGVTGGSYVSLKPSADLIICMDEGLSDTNAQITIKSEQWIKVFLKEGESIYSKYFSGTLSVAVIIHSQEENPQSGGSNDPINFTGSIILNQV